MKSKIVKCFLFLGMISCKYDKNVSPEASCQADVLSVVSYKNNVQKILVDNCNACHSNANHSGGVKLENFEDVKFWASSGILLDQIISVNGSIPQMPKGGKLSDCDVKLISNWIKQGELNN